MNAFTLKDITYTYTSTRQNALRDLSFDFPGGKVTVILGPNGAGKSTLMDLLLSFREAQRGEIILFGKPLKSYTKQELGSLIGLVPQEERSRFAFTAFEFTLFGRAPYLHHMKSPQEEDYRAAEAALDMVGMSHLAHRPVGQLSGGEHQLLLFARVLAQDPEVILLDEPTSALDPANTSRIIDIINLLKRKGKTLIITTHDPMLASEAADTLLMIRKGELLYSGDTSEILTGTYLTQLYDTPLTTVSYEDRILITRKM